MTKNIQQNLDTTETMFFQRELEAVESKLYEEKQLELKARQIFPVRTDTDPGAAYRSYYMTSMSGMAKIIGDYADDLPAADIFAREYTAYVKTLGVSFHYTTQEIRAARFANRPLETRKAASARRAIRELEDRLVWNGDVNHNIQGLVDHPNVSTQAATTGTAASTLWANKLGREILDDFGLAVRTMRSNSSGVWSPDSVIVGEDEYAILQTRYVDPANGSNVTVLDWIMQNKDGFGIKNVWAVEHLEDAFTVGTANAAVFFVRDPEVAEIDIPMEMTMHPPQQKNLKFNIPVESRFTGLIMRHPLAFLFLTGI